MNEKEYILKYEQKNGILEIMNEKIKKTIQIKKYTIQKSIEIETITNFIFYNSENGEYTQFYISRNLTVIEVMKGKMEIGWSSITPFLIKNELYLLLCNKEKGNETRFQRVDYKNQINVIIKNEKWVDGWSIIESFSIMNELKYLTYKESTGMINY
jgi:hypothetical protein